MNLPGTISPLLGVQKQEETTKIRLRYRTKHVLVGVWQRWCPQYTNNASNRMIRLQHKVPYLLGRKTFRQCMLSKVHVGTLLPLFVHSDPTRTYHSAARSKASVAPSTSPTSRSKCAHMAPRRLYTDIYSHFIDRYFEVQ